MGFEHPQTRLSLCSAEVLIVIQTLKHFFLARSVGLDWLWPHCNAVTVQDVLQATLRGAANAVLGAVTRYVPLLARSLKGEDEEHFIETGNNCDRSVAAVEEYSSVPEMVAPWWVSGEHWPHCLLFGSFLQATGLQ